MASKRIWTDMFKLQHDTPPLTQAESKLRDQRITETKARWNPLKEQIDILESIFNSGIENPNREEIRSIAARLRDIGEVGDANVFYWFQNRKSRKKRAQRRMDAAKEKANGATSAKPTTLPDPIQSTTPNPPLNHLTTSRNPNQTRSTPKNIATIAPNTIQTMVPNPIQAVVPNPIHMMTMQSPNFSTLSASAPVSTFPTIPPSVSSFPTMPPSVLSFANHQMQQAQQVFSDPFINLQQDAMFGGATTDPYNYNTAIPVFAQDYYSSFMAPENLSYPLNVYQGHEAVMPLAPSVTHPDDILAGAQSFGFSQL